MNAVVLLVVLVVYVAVSLSSAAMPVCQEASVSYSKPYRSIFGRHVSRLQTKLGALLISGLVLHKVKLSGTRLCWRNMNSI